MAAWARAFATWTNQSALANTTVTQANGLTVTWSGGDSSEGSYIDIGGSSQTPSGANRATVTFECVAPASAGKFTIPPSALLALPAANGGLVLSSSFFESVNVPGFNLAWDNGEQRGVHPIVWK
jgi:hypothetical protein